MFSASRPVDGEPHESLVRNAKNLDIFLAETFLAKCGKEILNTFMLASPDRVTATHDKGFPATGIESSFYVGGDDRASARKLRKDGFVTLSEVVLSRKRESI